jgi:hypothetical protein
VSHAKTATKAPVLDTLYERLSHHLMNPGEDTGATDNAIHNMTGTWHGCARKGKKLFANDTVLHTLTSCFGVAWRECVASQRNFS